jgi:HPt (histidine-containing phosphotransfer) domain-containing protein
VLIVPADRGGQPAISPHVLRALSEEMGPDIARTFAERYVAMLDGRMARIRAALAGDDGEDARVAALSLHCSSAMVGAEAVAGLARKTADAAHAGAVDQARAHLPELEARAEEAATTLTQVLLRTGDGPRVVDPPG